MTTTTTKTTTYVETIEQTSERDNRFTPLRRIASILLGLWSIFSIYWYVCEINNNNCSCRNKKISTVADVISKPKLPTLNIKDDTIKIAQANSNLRFARNNNNPIINSEVNASLNQLNLYLKNHSDRQLQVVGHYTANEKNTSAFENLGLARADAIKKHLIGLGLNGNLISTSANLNPAATFYLDTLYGGIDFNLQVTQKVAEKLSIEPRNLYFESGKFAIAKDEELTRYLQNVRTYLLQNADKKAILTGHTDNVGEDAKNMQLGAKRAETCKKIFVDSGINPAQIETLSKGETRPIEDNNTEQGKNKNRRVEIIIK